MLNNSIYINFSKDEAIRMENQSLLLGVMEWGIMGFLGGRTDPDGDTTGSYMNKVCVKVYRTLNV